MRLFRKLFVTKEGELASAGKTVSSLDLWGVEITDDAISQVMNLIVNSHSLSEIKLELKLAGDKGCSVEDNDARYRLSSLYEFYLN